MFEFLASHPDGVMMYSRGGKSLPGDIERVGRSRLLFTYQFSPLNWDDYGALLRFEDIDPTKLFFWPEGGTVTRLLPDLPAEQWETFNRPFAADFPIFVLTGERRIW
jgi:hypothetical protein